MGRTSGPLLLLLFCAHLYSRVLSMTGFTEAAKSFLLSTGAGPWDILPVMVGIWFVLGCLINFISIMLLTVPIFAPIATHLGLFAWIQWQRRILVRWKYHTPNFLGFVQLACLLSSSGDFELGSSDIVTISTEKIGALVNRVRLSPDCPSCTYGVRHLMWDLGSKDLI